MTREYHPLSEHRLQAGARYHLPGQDPERVRIDSPALAVMTDLRQIPAATIDLDAPLDAANRFMIRRGVRLLLVTDDERDVLNRVTAVNRWRFLSALEQPDSSFQLEIAQPAKAGNMQFRAISDRARGDG